MITKEQKYKIIVFIITFLSYTSIHACRTSWSSAKKKLVEKGISEKELGNCDTLFLFVYGLGNLLIGHKGDDIDLRIFIGLGLAGTIVSYGLISLLGFIDVYNPVYFYLL